MEYSKETEQLLKRMNEIALKQSFIVNKEKALWDSFYKQANEENWDEITRKKIAKEIKEGRNQEIKEAIELGVLKR